MEKPIKIYPIKYFEDSTSGCIINMDMMRFRKSTRIFVTIGYSLCDEPTFCATIIIIIDEVVSCHAMVLVFAVCTYDVDVAKAHIRCKL